MPQNYIKFSEFQAAAIKIKTTTSLAANRTVPEAQIVTIVFLITAIMPQYSFNSGKFYGQSMWS